MMEAGTIQTGYEGMVLLRSTGVADLEDTETGPNFDSEVWQASMEWIRVAIRNFYCDVGSDCRCVMLCITG